MRLRLGLCETGSSLTRDSIRIAVNPFVTRSIDSLSCRTLLLSSRLALVTRGWARCVSPTEAVEMPMRFLITFCIGVAVTLAWQSYGDAAREMIASSSPQLGWLAPQDAVAQTAPATIAPTASSPDPQELKAVSVDLAEVRQRVDQLAAQV